MGLLSGGIASIFNSALSGLYLDGLLHRGATNPVYDASGNIVGYSGGGDLPIKVQRDACSWAMRQSGSYVDGDVMLIVLAAGLNDVAITTDMEITDGQGRRWMVESADLDAASSHWICRGRKAAVQDGDDPDESAGS